MAISETKGIIGTLFLIAGIYYFWIAIKEWRNDRRNKQ